MSKEKQKVASDGFFSALENTKPYLKVAFEGFAGSGKTRTMAELAVGLHKRIGSTKPIVCFDTEKAAVFLRKFFEEHGIKILHKESRTLADLTETMKRCRDGIADVLLIDSISHVWENFLQSYQKQKGRTKLQFEDWGIIKPKWKAEFSEPFVRDKYHAIMCGRAGYEYSDEKDENGKRQIYKSGVKMKVEGETAYEPDVLVMMERFEDVLGEKKRVWREATIIKDRSALIDGKTFENPKYDHFKPAVEYLLDGAVDRQEFHETENNFEGDEAKREYVKRRDIALENLEAEVITLGLSGQSAEAKHKRVLAFAEVFGTASWTAIKGLTPDTIEGAIERLRTYVASKQEAA
jgi:hypothetical protein